MIGAKGSDKSAREARTINNPFDSFSVRGGKVYVNGAQVVTADIVAPHGVIHVIDTVPLPQAAPATAGR